MPQYDLGLEQLAEYRTDVAAPGDLDAFWAVTLDEDALFAPRPCWFRSSTG